MRPTTAPRVRHDQARRPARHVGHSRQLNAQHQGTHCDLLYSVATASPGRRILPIDLGGPPLRVLSSSRRRQVGGAIEVASEMPSEVEQGRRPSRPARSNKEGF